MGLKLIKCDVFTLHFNTYCMSAGTLSNIHETGAFPDNQKYWFANNNFLCLKVAVAFVSWCHACILMILVSHPVYRDAFI